MEYINLGSGIVNAYLISCGDNYALVDTGYPFEWNGFLKRAKKNNITLDKIKYVIITHIHADHVGFLKKLLDASGAKLIYNTLDKERLKSGRNVEDVYISSKGNLFSSRISVEFRRFTQFFEAVDAVDAIDVSTQPLREFGIEFFSFKGHTSNDVCIKVGTDLFCGDLCMNGTGAVNHSPMWIEDNEALSDSWEQLLDLGCDRLLPAHGKPFTVKDLSECIPIQKTMRIYKL